MFERTKHFFNQTLGQFYKDPPEYTIALRLYLEYYVATEAYARSITPHRREDGNAHVDIPYGIYKPATLAHEFSKAKHRELTERLAGIDPELVKRARRTAGHWPYERQVTYLERLRQEES